MADNQLPPINLAEKFSKITRYWTPGIIAELNNQYVKLAKAKGELVWHAHAAEDELFLVINGRFTLRFRDGNTVTMGPGEMYVVPRGVEHLPVADEEAHVLVFEPKSTNHTGDVRCEQTVEELDWI